MKERVITIDIADEQATRALGQRVAALLPSPAVIELNGDLGAGKTRLVQAIATHHGATEEDVVSPTFTHVNQYSAARPIYHLDAYRLRDADEFYELGVEEFFAQRDSIVIVEWGNRVADLLPPDRLRIAIATTGPTTRQFQFSLLGPRHDSAISALSDY